jgi:ATPase subunit of ABC transporter with duplicated ATPase domains
VAHQNQRTGIVAEHLLEEVQGFEVEVVGGLVVIGYLKDFLFAPEQARTPVSVLSGGERNRLLIARALASRSPPARHGPDRDGPC